MITLDILGILVGTAQCNSGLTPLLIIGINQSIDGIYVDELNIEVLSLILAENLTDNIYKLTCQMT